MSEQDKKKQLAKWVDAHVDGLLKPEQQAQFDRALKSNAYLRAEIEKQKRIDDSLKRQFAAPSAEEVLQRAFGDNNLPTGKPSRRRKSWAPAMKYSAIAAAVALIVGGGSWVWLTLGGGAVTPQPSRDLVAVFHETVDQGFKPNWVCKTDKQFFLTLYNRFGQGLLLASTMPPDIKALGWSYGLAITPKTAYLLADVKGHKSIVFIDEAGYERDWQLPADCKLHLHQRKIGDLILYEVTDLEEPGILEYFYEKELPEEWESGVMGQ